MLLGIIKIPAWGVGFIPQSAWMCFEKDENLIATIQAKLHGVLDIGHLESNKHNQTKEMDVISKYHDFEIIQWRYFSIFLFYFILTLFAS
jgi:hypothetical protein